MKKGNTTATALMVGLMSGAIHSSSAHDMPTYDISNHIKNIKLMVNRKATTRDVFVAVEQLAESLSKLNILIKSKISHITPSERQNLLLVNQALDFGLALIKNNYEDEIYNEFFNEFRKLSSNKNTLEVNLRAIQEKSEGVEIARVVGLSLTQDDINEMMKAKG